MLEAGGGDVNHAKIAAKATVGLVILVLVMANVRKPKLPDGLFYGIFALTVLNIGIAVFWSPRPPVTLNRRGSTPLRVPGRDGWRRPGR